MARFLFTVWPLCGHLFPQIAIAHALREREHEVAFYTGARACPLVEQEGFRSFSFEWVDEAFLDCLLFSPNRCLSWTQPRQLSNVFRAWLLDTIPQQVADLQKVVAEWRPDVIGCDVTMWGPPLILAETGQAPVAICSFTIGCMAPGPDAPPWGLGLPPPRSYRTRLLTRIVAGVTDLLAAGFRERASAIRRQYGLAPLAVPVHQFMGQMPLYLVCGAPELDYERRDLPASVRYVGPVMWHKPCDAPLPAWLDLLPKDQPWVHVTEGTMHTQRPVLLPAAAQGLADLPMQVIMTTGDDRSPAQLGLDSIAPNIRMTRWIPHCDLLPQTDVVVTVGGAGTVLAALAAGAALLVVPMESDQPDNAQRVVESGAGLRLARARCKPRQLRRAVQRLLDDPSFAQNSQRLSGALARCGGPSRAAELLEQVSGM